MNNRMIDRTWCIALLHLADLAAPVVSVEWQKDGSHYDYFLRDAMKVCANRMNALINEVEELHAVIDEWNRREIARAFPEKKPEEG